jgi:hypothetical protein
LAEAEARKRELSIVVAGRPDASSIWQAGPPGRGGSAAVKSAEEDTGKL